jgi:nucleoside phosphorylase
MSPKGDIPDEVYELLLDLRLFIRETGDRSAAAIKTWYKKAKDKGWHNAAQVAIWMFEADVSPPPAAMAAKGTRPQTTEGVTMPAESTKIEHGLTQSASQLAVTIGIVTALAKEFAAVKVLLQNQRDHFVPGKGAGRRYVLGEIPAPNGGMHTVALALLSDTGNNQAAARAAMLLEHFPTVDNIIMTGIAGAVPHPDKPEEHVRLGDIIVTNRGGVVQYDFVKKERKQDGEEEWEEDTHRYPPRAPSAILHEAATHLEAEELQGNRPWDELIEFACERLQICRPAKATDVLTRSDNPSKQVPHPVDPDRKPELPRVFRGVIASANILLKDPKKRDALRDKFNVRAVEMENSGIGDATWNRGAGYLGVRGGCDYCDVHKGDAWQKYAAAVAAGYTVSLIRNIPLQRLQQQAASPAQAAAPSGDRLGAIPENDLRRLLTDRLGREEIGVLWFDTLGELMGDDMNGKGKSECVMELIVRVNRRNLMSFLIGNIRQERPDLAD